MSPVRHMCMALDFPIALVSLCVPPAPGMIPRLISGLQCNTYLGTFCTQDDVAHHRQFVSTSQAIPRNGRDDRRPPKPRDILPLGKHVGLVDVLEAPVLHLGNIGTGGEAPWGGSRQDHALDVRVFVEDRCGVDYVPEEIVVQGVHGLGPVQLDDRYLSISLLWFFHDDVVVGFLKGRRRRRKAAVEFVSKH
ncbi:unnamed protein product [Pseudo-nitzschia multistriata]|uniref:Secreted protein n=1 Tax=Pseudo-nitzschia multistriata TaxID=183589 RepID=A0A448ZLH3_9STRA|nr:unnamed protein product [Pseudo-nitzschia multistriata]